MMTSTTSSSGRELVESGKTPSPFLPEFSAYLDRIVSAPNGVAVALSGGIDSTTLLHVAATTFGPPRVLALTGVSPSLSTEDLRRARQAATSAEVEHVEVPTHELRNPAYRENHPDRCYHCKSTLFDALAAHVPTDWVLLEGTTKDELDGHRPGFKAGQERGVQAPFAACGVDKASVRGMAKHLGLADSGRPASPCLSSRVQYGQAIDAQLLARIGRAEASLRALGFGRCRVRVHGAIARIEVPVGELHAACSQSAAIVAAVQSEGFTYTTLDLAGLRSGSLLEMLPEEDR